MKTTLPIFLLLLLIFWGSKNSALAQVNLQIPSTDIPPVIDGLNEPVWGTTQSYNLTNTLFGSATSTSDFSAYFKTLWDKDNLYVLAIIKDESKINDSGEVWQDDAVEVYIDINNDKLESYTSTDFQYTFRWDDFTVHTSHNEPTSGIEFKILSTTTGYILEVKFPWTTLGLASPKSGILLGFDLHVHDDDDGGVRDNKLAWFTTDDNSWQHPSLFATAKLVDEVVIQYPAEKPKISVKEGFYKKPFDVVISTSVDEMKIYYTLDGSDPASSEFVKIVDSPAKVRIDPQDFQNRGKTPAVVLRARSKSEKYDFSPIATHTYLFVDKMDIQTSFPEHDWPRYDINGQWIDLLVNKQVLADARYTNLIDDALLEVPTISVTTDNFNLFDPDSGIYVNAMGRGLNWERPASIELINPNGSNGFQIDAGLRIRGGYSRTSSFRKHAFRLFFRNEYGEGKLNFPLFENEGVKSFDKIDLRCAQNYSWSKGDGNESPLYTFTRDVFSRDIQGKMDQEYTKSRYYHLYLNGLYWGLYQTQERPEATFAAAYMGGDRDDYDVVKRAGETDTIEATDGNLDAWREVWDMCQKGFTYNVDYYKIQGLNESGVRDPNLKVLVDIDNLIDYMNLIFYTGNYDAPVSAFFQNKEPNNFFAIYNRNDDRGFVFLSHDNEHTLLIDPINMSRGLLENRVNIGRITGNKMEVNDFRQFHPQWLHFKLSENAEYRQRFSDRSYKQYFNKGVFTPETGAELFEKRTLEIDTAVIAESARWGVDQRGKLMTKDDNWVPSVNKILTGFFPFRTDIVIGQLQEEGLLSKVKAPLYKIDNIEVKDETIKLATGDALSISDPDNSGNVIYTIDGSDPRLVGDGVSSTATNGGKTTTISILQTCVLKSRVFNNGNWSPIHTLNISINSQFNGLQLTEIHYNPLGQKGISGSEYEFIELKNSDNAPYNLTAFQFIDGIKYNFSKETILDPGKFIVLASSANSFKERYGFAPSGEYDGQLDNNGERITLVNAIGDTIISVKYNNQKPWPTTPDSVGFSLVPSISGLSADWNDGNNWRASSSVGGSPNADDKEIEISPVLISEILTNSEEPMVDAIELYNPNSSEVNLGGWYLSDKRETPKKWMIPSGTVIPANGYLVFYERHYVNSTLAHSPSEFGSSFSLSSYGEEVYLFSGTPSGELTGYEYGFDFGAIEPGITFGRHINSVGKEHFVAQKSSSLNEANGQPRVGPVIINQIMYNPPVGQFEFLELKNISQNTVKLYEESNWAPWQVAGIDFEFPMKKTLAPGQSVYLIESMVSPSDFRAIFNLDPTALVFNYSGSLKNEGEEITLFKSYKTYSDKKEEKVSYIRVDKVDYNDNNLWADTDGNGYALQRIDSLAYGNDPASWIATPPGMRIKNSFLPDAFEGVYYSRELSALGGIAPFSWSISSGSLTEGLSLNPVNGIIDGIPTQTGTFKINISVEDSDGASKTVELSLKVNPNTLPEAVNDTIVAYKNHSSNLSVLENDKDNDGDKSSWAVSIIEEPIHGTAVVNNDRKITYTPNANHLGSDTLKYSVSDMKGGSEATLVIQVVEDWILSETYLFASLNSDDAEENINTKVVNLNSTSLKMGVDPATNASQLVGIRFANLKSIPENAIIIYSCIGFNSAGIQTSPASLTIQGESSLNPVTYTTGSPISSRPVTATSVTWNPEPWEKEDYSEYIRSTADVTPIMNELKGMGWKPNNPIAFVIKGTGTRSARSVNSGFYNGPLLYVIYTDPDVVIATPVAAIKNVTNIGEGDKVQLDGTTSNSSDGRLLNYYWTLVSKPDGSNAQLSNPASAVPSFIADQFGEYVVSLKVDNGKLESSTVTLAIQVANQQPIANAGSDQTKCQGTLIRLNGSGSSDANGDMLTYKWEWIQKPEGSTATLSSVFDVNPKFTADLQGKYALGLTVSDKYSSSISDTVEITITQNQQPLANAGNDKEVITGSVFSLDGTKSSDPEDDQLTYSWSILSKPDGSKAVLSDSTFKKPTVKTDLSGDYLYSLVVSDGINTSLSDEVKVTVVSNNPPVALAGNDQTKTEHLTVSLNGSESYDPENMPIYYQWSFVSKPFGSMATILNPNIAKPSFIPDTEGLYAIKLRISDGTFTSEDQLLITALNDVAVNTFNDINSWKVYPNPFNDKLVVEYFSEVNQDVTFSLYNITGSLIKTFEFNSIGKNTRVLNFENENLIQGMYLLVMKSENGNPKVIKVNH